MADLTEKQQLLKEIKHLSDLISHAKQRDVNHMQRCSGSKPTISGNMKKQQQQPGNSTPTSTSSFSASVLSVFSSSAEALTPAAFDSAARQISDGKMSQKAHLVSVQEQAIPQSLKRNTSQIQPQLQKGNTSQIHCPCRDLNTTSTCTQQCSDQRKGIIHRRFIVSKLDPTIPLLCSGNGTKSATQNYVNCAKREALKEYATMLAKCTSAQVSAKPLLSVKIRKHTASSLPGKVLSQVPSIIKVQQNHCVSGQKSPTNQPHPVQSAGGSESRNSLRKSKVFSKNAEVMAAREAMQKEIEDMKSKLANIAAAKKSKSTKNAANKCVLHKDEAFSEGKIQSCHIKEVGEKAQVLGITGSPKLENVAVSGSPVKGSKQEPAMNGHSLPVSSQPASPHRTFKAEQGSSEKEDVIIVEKQLNNCSKLLPVATDAELLYPSSCANTEMENMTPVEIFRKSPCSSPSRFAAKANLEKELKATEEKLQDMRKKMGMILKDSPQNSDLNVKGGRESSPRHQQACLNVSSCTQAITTHVSSSPVNQRPFPHRASLKWTPQKFPRRKSSEHVLVIGSSPNMRTLSLSSATASLSKQTVRVCGKNVTPVNTSGKKQTPRRKKSQYSSVKNDSVPVGDESRNSASQTSVREVQKSLNSVSSSSAFVSRYKVQRVGSGSKRGTLAPSSQQKTVVQSRFKLMKFVSRDSPHSPTNAPGMSPLLSAKQRAAKIIKSKYKLKGEFLPSPHGYSTVQMNQYLKPKHLTARNGFIHSPSTLRKHNHFSYNNGYRLSHSFLPTGAGRGRGVFKQRRTGLAHFQSVRWKGGFFMGTSPAEWGIQMSPLLQSKCHRVWKRKGKKGQTMYDQLAQCVQMKRMQRLYWKNIHSLRKQASHQVFISQKKRNLSARCERLVMINSTVYKSSSSRLIKACSVSSPSTKSGAAGTSALSNMPAGTRGGKRLGMKMVMVRGVCFKVDARGTKLQRVINSAKKGKMAAVSGGADENVMPSVRTRYVINRVKQRSIFVAAAAKSRKKEGKSTKKHCLYFSRFGKCSRGDACPFLHDPARIAVCTRFLRGTCQVENCPFSHKVSKEKMPVCAFFLKGVCTRDACPYLHVKVNQGAEICQDFISGFCPLAEKCPKLHTLTCPHFAKTGVCPDGKKCRLVHRKSTGAKRHRVKTSSSSTHSSSTPRDRSFKNRKRPVESNTVEETWQHAKEVEGGAPSSKYFRPDSGRQSEQEVQNCSSFLKTLLGSQTASVEAEGMRSADSGYARSIEPGEENGGTSSQGQLPTLPAFISLADYSFEESPVVQGRVNRSRKSAEQSIGPNLKIKPHF